jgi:exopolysaccharide production protein ExoZ
MLPGGNFMERLVSVQVLRAFAALSILGLHTSYLPEVAQAGVDLFFVISGFVMVYSSGQLFGKTRRGPS